MSPTLWRTDSGGVTNTSPPSYSPGQYGGQGQFGGQYQFIWEENEEPYVDAREVNEEDDEHGSIYGN